LPFLPKQRAVLKPKTTVIVDYSSSSSYSSCSQVALVIAIDSRADGNFEAQACSCSVSVGNLEPCVTTGIIDQIRTAIENVVRNAIRHTKVNSEVEITVRKQGDPPNGAAVVGIRDHGPGVADSDLQKIFQPFYRASSNGSNSEGSGLGLAITDRIARKHGGMVRAVNAPTGGLLVEPEFPLNA